MLAEVDFAIIGMDFLRHFKLAADLASGQLVDTRDMCNLAGEASLAVDGSLLAAVAATSPQYCSLFSYYPAVASCHMSGMM